MVPPMDQINKLDPSVQYPGGVSNLVMVVIKVRVKHQAWQMGSILCYVIFEWPLGADQSNAREHFLAVIHFYSQSETYYKSIITPQQMLPLPQNGNYLDLCTFFINSAAVHT